MHRHREAVAGEVPGQVAAHHRQPRDTDLGLGGPLRSRIGGRGINHVGASRRGGAAARAFSTAVHLASPRTERQGCEWRGLCRSLSTSGKHATEVLVVAVSTAA